MFKQIYRYFSILLISNLLLTSAVFSKPQKSLENFIINESYKTINDQKDINKDPNLEKMPSTHYDEGRYTTLYGVADPDHIYNTYPSENPNENKQ